MQKFGVLVTLIVLGCSGKTGGGNNSARPASPQLAMPGACVDPLADATARLKTADAEIDPPSANPCPDLDGDGVADQVVTGGPISGYNENGLVYVMRGGCGHYVGNITTTISELPMPVVRHHTLADIKVPEVSACEGSQCGCEPGWRWFRFDGKAYVEDVPAGQPSQSKSCN